MLRKLMDMPRKLRIRQKILLLTILVVFFSDLSLFFITNRIYINAVQSRASNYSANMIDQMIKYADSYFHQIESIALTIAYNQMIQQSLSRAQPPENYEGFMTQQYIDNSLKLIVYSRNDLQIAVFGLNNRSMFYTSYAEINPNYDFTADAWYAQAVQSEKKRMFLTDNPQNYYVSGNRKQVYTFLYKINDYYSQEIIGYILMDIDKTQFDDSFHSHYLDIESTMILGADGSIVYAYPADDGLEAITRSIAMDDESGALTTGTGADAKMVIFGSSEYLDWKIVTVLRLDSLVRDIGAKRMLLLFIALALFALAVLASVYISRSITDPIVKLARGMDKVQNGEMQAIEPVRSRDEAGDLIYSFNSMIGQIGQLIQKNETIALIQKETELKALQQQINPHFLYNTLENVIGLASEGSSEKVIAICKNLGSMFRYNLSGRDTVCIKEELEQARRYTDILLERYEGKFHVVYDVQEEILGYRTIKFLLQPLIENAIGHGFRNMLGGGLLCVRACLTEDNILFEIIDNGEGMPQDVLDDILAQMKQYDLATPGKAEVPPHLGIMNVYMRLRLSYGEAFTMEIRQPAGGGTSVRIIMSARL